MASAPGRSLEILLAVHHFPPTFVGGAEQLAYRLARGMLGRGHRVKVICVEAIDVTSQNGRLNWVDQPYEGIPVRRLRFNLAETPDPLRWSFDNPLIESHLTDLLDAKRPDILHLISGYLMGIGPLRAAKRASVPTIVTLTDFWFLCPTIQLLRGDGSLCPGPEPQECARCLADARRPHRLLDLQAPFLTQAFWSTVSRYPALADWLRVAGRLEAVDARRKVLREALSSADAVGNVTSFVRTLHAANGVDPARFFHAPYSVDIAPPGMRRDDKELHFGYLGQIAPIKGVDILVRAFHQLDRKRRKARLTIHGSMATRPEYARRLKRLARNDPDIVFAGAYENHRLSQILSDLDVVIVPSLWYENSPTVILEAFAAGRPVIGTNVGGISEIVQNGVNGLLFERGNASALTAAMEEILATPKLLEHFRAGIPHIATTEDEIGLYLAAYGRVVSGSRPSYPSEAP